MVSSHECASLSEIPKEKKANDLTGSVICTEEHGSMAK
jgi:hypothetical protein